MANPIRWPIPTAPTHCHDDYARDPALVSPNLVGFGFASQGGMALVSFVVYAVIGMDMS